MASGVGMLTALTGLRVGDRLDQEEGKELLSLMTQEIVAVARGKGIELDARESIQSVLFACEEAREHITSMLDAFINNRKTEVGNLNEAIVKEAKKLGLAAPMNEAIALLVRTIEKTYERQVKIQ